MSKSNIRSLPVTFAGPVRTTSSSAYTSRAAMPPLTGCLRIAQACELEETVPPFGWADSDLDSDPYG